MDIGQWAVDWIGGEPECFACRACTFSMNRTKNIAHEYCQAEKELRKPYYERQSEEKKERFLEKKFWASVTKNWGQMGFDRAHIIPHCDGGPDSPDNLMLLCSECHSVVDDLFLVSRKNYEEKRREFLEWVEGRCENILHMLCELGQSVAYERIEKEKLPYSVDAVIERLTQTWGEDSWKNRLFNYYKQRYNSVWRSREQWIIAQVEMAIDDLKEGLISIPIFTRK